MEQKQFDFVSMEQFNKLKLENNDLKTKLCSKKEFTKQMYMFNVYFAVILTVLSFMLMAYSSLAEHIDLTPIAYIVPPVWIEIGVYSAFMIRKAEAENKRKYKDVNVTNTEMENEI